MARKAWRVLSAKTRISDATQLFLETGDRSPGHLATFTLSEDRDQMRIVWSAVREYVLEGWIMEHPCTRPFAWWQVEAPGPRLRLGGTGTPIDEHLAVQQRFRYGLPLCWASPATVSTFRVGVVPSPADPPVFESQAAYLARHRLLTVTERAHLAAHPQLVTHETL